MKEKRTARSRLIPTFLVTILCLIYSVAVIMRYGDPLVLMTIGSNFAPDELDARAYSEEGYDGEHIYYIARYGFDAEPYIDRPAYRMQRILLPALGALTAFGNVEWIPISVLFWNLLIVATSIWFFTDLLQSLNVSAWYVVGYGLALSILGSVRLSLTEPMAYGLAIIGIWLMNKDHWMQAAVIFAAAALAKESSLIFPAAYGAYLLIHRREVLRSLIFGTITLIPFIIWQAVLYSQLGEIGVGAGGATSTGFELIPFMGFLRILFEAGVTVFLFYLVLTGPFVLLPTLWALWMSWTDYRQKTWSIYTLLLFANAALMLFIPFSTYQEPLGILRFIAGLQVAVILYAAERRQNRTLRYSTLWIITSMIVINSDFAV